MVQYFPVITGSLTVNGDIIVSGTSSMSASNSVSSSYAYTASSAVSSSYAYSASSAVNSFSASKAVSSSYADTASFANNFTVIGNLTVFGTQSVQYITSSQLNVSDNVITVNVASPGVRFGGLSVFDSGSLSSEATASLFWDSQNNHWIYQRESGSSYTGGMLISGPRNSAGLGNELGTTNCMLLVGQGGDHLTSSMIYHDSARTCFYGTSLIVSSSGNVGIGVSQPSSPLSIAGTFNGNTPLICITGTGTGVYQRVIAAINSGMNVGDDLTIQMGTALSYRNVGQLNYHHEGACCATNRVSIGLYGVDDVLNVNGNGFVGIGTTTTCGLLSINAPLTSVPSIRFQNNITAGLDSAISNYVSAAQTLLVIGTNAYMTSLGNICRFNTGYQSSYLSFDEGTVRIGTSTSASDPTGKLTINSTGISTFACQVCISGAGAGLSFSGNNNRIYFGTCRAIEGSTSGTTLQIGEYYDKTQIQSSAQMYNGSDGNSPKLYFGAETNANPGAKAIYLETYWMIIQPHVNEGLRIRAVNGVGSQSTIAKFYGSGTFSLDQYSNGTLSVSGGVVVSSSDKCMKIDDGGIDIALPKIMCLNPRYFYWKSETCLNSCDRQLGFYAQDVSEALGTEVANQSHNCSWGIYDRGIIAMLTKGMQEQQCTINTLKTCIGIA